METKAIIAMIISIIFTGLGIAYLGDIKKGVCFFAAGAICSLLGLYFNSIFYYLALIIWAVALYFTYQEAQAIN